MYKCCFLACFCVRQHVQWLRAELTSAQIREKLPNGRTDWNQIWHTCAIHLGMDIRQTNCPSRHKGALGGALGGHKFKSRGKLSNGWTDWRQLWFTSADSSGNGHLGEIQFAPQYPKGHFGGVMGSQIQVWESCQTAGRIDTKFGTRRRIRLGMDIGYTQFAPRYPRVALGSLTVFCLGCFQRAGHPAAF